MSSEQDRSTLREQLRELWRRSWPLVRQVVGWAFIALGIAGLFLPLLQGLLFLVIGIALVGRRNWLLRWAAVHSKLFVRRWAAHPHPWLSGLGALALRAQHQLSRQRRRLAWRTMERRGDPGSPEARRSRHIQLVLLGVLGVAASVFVIFLV